MTCSCLGTVTPSLILEQIPFPGNSFLPTLLVHSFRNSSQRVTVASVCYTAKVLCGICTHLSHWAGIRMLKPTSRSRLARTIMLSRVFRHPLSQNLPGKTQDLKPHWRGKSFTPCPYSGAKFHWGDCCGFWLLFKTQLSRPARCSGWSLRSKCRSAALCSPAMSRKLVRQRNLPDSEHSASLTNSNAGDVAFIFSIGNLRKPVSCDPNCLTNFMCGEGGRAGRYGWMCF